MNLSRKNMMIISAAVLFAATASVSLCETADESDAAGGASSYSFDDGVLKYSIISSAPASSVSVVGWVGNPTAVTIPKSVNRSGTGYGVTAIGDSAFENCTSLKTVDFGNSKVGSIGWDTFRNCTYLTTVDFGNSDVKSIGDRAFENCTSLKTIDFENSKVESIGLWAFTGCSGLTVVDLSNVTIIGSFAFEGCVLLESITIDSAVRIKSGAFNGCSGLTTVTVTGDHAGGISGGVVDMYFTSTGNWNLQGADSITNLRLPHTVHRDYLPNNSGIVGAEGRILTYSDAEFEWDVTTSSAPNQVRWGSDSNGDNSILYWVLALAIAVILCCILLLLVFLRRRKGKGKD